MSTTQAGAPVLQVIIASTRPGRAGLPVGQWIAEHAGKRGDFEVEIVDLAELNLPLYDEPTHPRARRYTHTHTQRFSEIIDLADAFVIVGPEYNHSFNAALKNALDYLFHEWAHKPVGLVNYGGIAAGARAAQALKPVLNALYMTPVPESVLIPLVQTFLDGEEAERRFVPNTEIETGADLMLGALADRIQVSRLERSAS
jgi:NAD(P)H-dependent FMN reductase